MLDEQDRELQLVAHLADEADELERLLRIHPRRGLVEQQELGLRPERASHLEAPLVAVGQVARVVVSTPRQPAVVEQLACALMGFALLAPDHRRAQDAAEDAALQAAVHADEDVLERGHLLEEADVLERPADTALGGVCGGEPAMSLPSKTIAARRRLVDPGDHVEERRLAGAVRADQADDRALGDREVDVVDRDQAAELLAERVDLEQVGAHWPRPRRVGTSGAARRGHPPRSRASAVPPGSAPAGGRALLRPGWCRRCRSRQGRIEAPALIGLAGPARPDRTRRRRSPSR